MTMQENEAIRDVPLADIPDTSETTQTPSEYRDTLEFDTSVIEKIVGISAREIPGILGMKGGFITGITETFSSSDDITKGISADVAEQNVIIDMKVILEYGTSAPNIFDELKTKVRTALKDMTGLNLQELNVRVVDVMSRKSYEDASRKDGEQQQAFRQQQHMRQQQQAPYDMPNRGATPYQ